jgi:hypothetical protein
MQRDLAKFFSYPAQPEAQGSEPDAGEGEQEAGAEGKGVGL